MAKRARIVTEFDVTGSNDNIGHLIGISEPHEVHDFNFRTMDMSRVDNFDPGSDYHASREGTFRGLDVEDSNTSKLMEMVATLSQKPYEWEK
ncbi:hypothetical protein HN51_021676 [Arachis hypogaea]